MRGWKIFLIGLAIVLVVVLVGLFVMRGVNPRNAGISIQTNSKATVFIDGVRVGTTPYEATRKAGEAVIKLVPQVSSHPLSPFETKVTLVSGIKTVIRRDFGDTDDTSAGEIISFEKGNSGEVSLAIISIPDSAQVGIDGTAKSFAPYKTSNITAGQHQIVISSQGYQDRSLMVNAYAGYKLTAIVKLAIGGASASPSPSPTPTTKTYVQILSTPTGFLRVRDNPSTTANEIAQVKPGQKYPLTDEDAKTGWFEIEYLPGKFGWITNQYAKKVEQTTISSPTPTATPSSKTKA